MSFAGMVAALILAALAWDWITYQRPWIKRNRR